MFPPSLPQAAGRADRGGWVRPQGTRRRAGQPRDGRTRACRASTAFSARPVGDMRGENRAKAGVLADNGIEICYESGDLGFGHLETGGRKRLAYPARCVQQGGRGKRARCSSAWGLYRKAGLFYKARMALFCVRIARIIGPAF